MDKENLLIVIEELGEAIRQYKAARKDSDAEIEYLRHELKEHQKIIVDLEKELAKKDAEIARLSAMIKKSRGVDNG